MAKILITESVHPIGPELLAAAGKFFFYFCCFSDSSDPVSGTVDLYIVFCAAL